MFLAPLVLMLTLLAVAGVLAVLWTLKAMFLALANAI
jgi:hypothetical protein